MEPSFDENLNRSLLDDIRCLLGSFNLDLSITYFEFSTKWNELDFDLLAILAGSDKILGCLIQLGLFGPTRPFPHHQFLTFFLYSLYRATRQSFKLSADLIQILLGLRIRAKLTKMTGGEEVLHALESLFKVDAFTIVAEVEAKNFNFDDSATTSNMIISAEQLISRINRIDSFLSQQPLISQSAASSPTISRASLNRLKASFERYYESKRGNGLVLENEQDFGGLLEGIDRIVDGYERLLLKKNSSTCPLNVPSQSVRSRLSQSSLNPVIPSGTINTIPLFMPTPLQPSQVPTKRKTSAKDLNLDDFIETSTVTNMPNLNFY